MYTRVSDGGECRGRTGGVRRPWSGEHGIRGWGFGGNGWVVPISVACILACFIIAVSTLALLVLYILGGIEARFLRRTLVWSFG